LLCELKQQRLIENAQLFGGMMPYKILAVDNDPSDLECTRLLLEAESDFEVIGFLDADAATASIKQNPHQYAAILLDYRMPKDGIQVAQEMLAINPHLVIALNSADDSRELLKKCMSIGVKDFIEKKQDEETIRGIVRSLCQRWEENSELFGSENDDDKNQEIIESIGLIGRSSGMSLVAQIVRCAAKSDCSIFIRGESGTGKEKIAQAIHNFSNRRLKPFVGINLSSITESLFESEMFGHLKGSFTGATSDKKGLITSAHQGTLFLDEIGELTPAIQAKLLRVLQERKVTPVGSTKSLDVDIRVISATHVNLEKAINEGRFREDLYYRLHVMPIKIPPLRERKSDIAPLVSHFLKLYNGEHLEILKKTIRSLEAYSWPGNVRELQNEIERIVALRKTRIVPEDLNPKILNHLGADLEGTGIRSYQDFMKSQYEGELKYINSMIQKGGGLREACRTLLNASPSTISTRVKILEKNINVLSFKNQGGSNEKSINTF
jgi:DNA-binding NtrC family response regulator